MQESAKGNVRGLKAEIQAFTKPGFWYMFCYVLFKLYY